MKTPEYYLDEVVKAKSEYSKDFKELMLKYKAGDCVRVFVESVIEEAMLRHSKEACEERDTVTKELTNALENILKYHSDAKAKLTGAKLKNTIPFHEAERALNLYEKSILNAKSPIE